MLSDNRKNVRKSFAEQEAYWKNELSGELPVLEFPLDRPRPPVQSFIRESESVEFDKKFCNQIKAFCVQQNITLFVTLLGSLKTLLWRYTGQENVIVGSLSSDSILKKAEEKCKCYANPVVLKTNLAGEPNARELLRRVATTVENAAANRDYPFDELVKNIKKSQDLNQAPVFKIVLVQCNARFCISEPPISEEDLANVGEHIAICDLAFFVHEEGDILKIRCEYDAELFESATIARLLGHFRVLLEGMTTNAEERLSTLPLLTKAEQYQLLVEWNDTKTDYPQDVTIHELFEAQAERRPDAVAVIFGDEKLTYSGLNCRANQLAHHLQGLGVGQEVLVGIFVERSLDMLVGLLGILKAGGAYVPLDPAYPEKRLAFMLEDAHPPVLLTQKQLSEKLPAHESRILFLDSDWTEIAQENEKKPVSRATGNNLAYVIYTSGSTGKPKGVQISHDALSNFLYSMQQQPGLIRQDILLAVTTLSFDIAALELFLPLIAGARVVLADHETVIDGVRLADQITKHGVTVMQATPATWRLLAESGWKGKNTLKALCGGEAFPLGLASQLAKQVGFLWNMYGPTETTIWSGVCKVEAEDSLIPIGLPIANTSFYVLDACLNPVPVGVPGELYIGGSGLARGYLNRPELTAEKFVANPFNKELASREPEEARIYGTGDLVRYLSDGNIEFLGRIDHQVKVRGFRIELGEIEAVLAEHPSVTQCVVIAREDRPGDKSLTAYLVPDQEKGPSVSELHGFLKEKLPDYMIPSAFVEMKALPLTPNGKTDRRALPVPDTCRPELDAIYVVPQSEVERFIADVWQQMLVVDKVGIHDNYFELGGNSLLTAQIHHKLQKKYEKKLSVIDMFEYPTIHSLAQYIQSEKYERPRSMSGRARAETRADREASMRRQSQFRQNKKHQIRDKDEG